jgi:replication factor C subunit 1
VEQCHRTKKPKAVLIMDEVDGMSAGDRGGVADLIASIKISKIPIVCICNDRYSQKLKSLVNYCLLLNFRKPTKQQVISCHIYIIMFYENYF